MQSLKTSLSCLAHPVTLASLVLLLLNDHVLKTLTPSWLTGKLSDFAGLFFFPFLLATLVAFLFRERLTTRQVGALAFGITAVWFAGMKLTVWGNVFTEQFASFVLQTRAQIVQDPTDVIALGVMLPGWKLWGTRKTQRPPRWAWLVLLVAAFASMATSPIPNLEVQSVSSEAGEFYAQGYYIPLSKSVDGGVTWQVQERTFLKRVPPASAMLTTCEPTPSRICYRIEDEGQYNNIQESVDGGATWQLAWEIPPERRLFLRRLGTSCGLLGCSRIYTPGPHTLALGSPIGSNGRYTLIAAMGSEGVLVRTSEGEWNQYGVGQATPTPMVIRDLSQWHVIGPEIELVIYLSLGVMILLALGGWIMCIGFDALGVVRPLWISLALIALGAFLFDAFPIKRWGWGEGMFALVGWWVYPILALWLVIALFASAYWVALRAFGAKSIKQVLYISILSAIVFSIVTWLPMLAWAFGIIETYRMAWNVSIAVAFVTCACALLLLWRISRAARLPKRGIPG
jgi:hypothetical protein